MVKRLEQSEVVERFRAQHGDRYDYSRLNYRGMAWKVTIICPEHGEFVQDAGTHARGSGCPRCYYDSVYHRRIAERDARINAAICGLTEQTQEKQNESS